MRRLVWVIASMMVVLLAAAVTVAIVRPALWQTIWSFLYDYRWWARAAVVAVAVLLLWLLGKLLQRPRGTPWRAHVLATADALQYELEALPTAVSPAERDLRDSVSQAVRHHLQVARKAVWPEDNKRLPVAEAFLDWWTGAPIEAAYVNLHEAEIALAQLLPDDQIQARIPEALARLQTMDVTDPRRQAAERQLASSLSGSQYRAAFQSAVRIGLELKDLQHDRLRAFRNVVLTTTAALGILVVAVCVVGAWKPDALPLCFGPEPTTGPGQPPQIQGPAGVACPSGEEAPTPGDVTLVSLLGLLGGGLSAAVAIRGLQSSSTPYNVPVALSLLKLPSGAVSALVGLLFIRGGFVPGLFQLDSQSQILAYAFLFGIAQQLFTRLVDQRAQSLLGSLSVDEMRPADRELAPPPPVLEERLASLVRETLLGEPLDAYDGLLVVQLFSPDGEPVAARRQGEAMRAGGTYRLVAYLAQAEPPDAAAVEPVAVSGQRRPAEVSFALSALADVVSVSPRQIQVWAPAYGDSEHAEFNFVAPLEPVPLSLWVQLHQRDALVQVARLALSPEGVLVR